MKNVLKLFLFLFASSFVQAQAIEPDDRFKADILVVVAHPDDEGMAIGYLAKAVLDLHKRVAVVFGTRGDGGGNAIGNEQAASLGAEREIEARRAVGTLGITNVWFLGAPDTPGQNVLRSLEAWNHGSSLGQVVRLVRLTRPQVIMTWLPAYSAGENHGDHQAASVLATEAFDLAADPTAFPEQVTPTPDHTVSGNLTEGLHPWQPKKLYFFSDTANPAALDGKGPQYPWTEMSPSRKLSYGRLALESIANHRTQDYPGLTAVEALKQPGLGALKDMKTRLVLGKSLVEGTVTGDVFEGVVPEAVPFKRVSGYQATIGSGVSAELGGPWAFYRLFWKAHDLAHVGEIFKPEVRVGIPSQVHIPVLLHNDMASVATFDVTSTLPDKWSAVGTGRFSVAPHETVAVNISVVPLISEGPAQPVAIAIAGPAGKIAELSVAVSMSAGALPQ